MGRTKGGGKERQVKQIRGEGSRDGWRWREDGGREGGRGGEGGMKGGMEGWREGGEGGREGGREG